MLSELHALDLKYMKKPNQNLQNEMEDLTARYEGLKQFHISNMARTQRHHQVHFTYTLQNAFKPILQGFHGIAQQKLDGVRDFIDTEPLQPILSQTSKPSHLYLKLREEDRDQLEDMQDQLIQLPRSTKYLYPGYEATFPDSAVHIPSYHDERSVKKPQKEVNSALKISTAQKMVQGPSSCSTNGSLRPPLVSPFSLASPQSLTQDSNPNKVDRLLNDLHHRSIVSTRTGDCGRGRSTMLYASVADHSVRTTMMDAAEVKQQEHGLEEEEDWISRYSGLNKDCSEHARDSKKSDSSLEQQPWDHRWTQNTMMTEGSRETFSRAEIMDLLELNALTPTRATLLYDFSSAGNTSDDERIEVQKGNIVDVVAVEGEWAFVVFRLGQQVSMGWVPTAYLSELK